MVSGRALVGVDLAESGTLGTAAAIVGWGGCLTDVCGLSAYGAGWGAGCEGCELFLAEVFPPPLAECPLVEVQPVLLWANYHTRPHEAHEGYEVVGGETVAIDKVRADETPSAAETSFAVDGDVLLLLSDHFVGESNKLLDHVQGRVGAIVENHIHVLNAQGGEVRG